MDEQIFGEYRPLLFSIAYRMMGTVMESEDIVQDAYIRFVEANPTEIQSYKAYLTTIVTRLCIDRLQSAQVQRETRMYPWLPEPVAGHTAEMLNPADHVLLSESLSLAFLVLLEQLSPSERAVLLLRDVFDYDYDMIAQIMGRAPTACRQLYSRAKKHIHEGRPRYESSPEAHHELLGRFLQAIGDGEVSDLVNLLAHDAMLVSDGEGLRGAATRPIQGAEKVARFLLGSQKRLKDWGLQPSLQVVNGKTAVVLRYADGTVYSVLSIETHDGQITALHLIGSPAKLGHLS